MTVNMKIGTRILAGYALALLVVVGVGIISYRGVTELVENCDMGYAYLPGEGNASPSTVGYGRR